MGRSHMRSGVTAVIPSIPSRVQTHLHRAIDSVLQQQYTVNNISVHVDHERRGAAASRTRALSGVGTEWSALLDDDDEWGPEHIGALMEHARETGADLVYPWFDIQADDPPPGWGGAFDPWPGREGAPFDEEALRRGNYIPITVLVRTELLWAAGGFTAAGPPDNPCDDHGTWLSLLGVGAVFSHLPRRTWTWHWWAGNTNGRPDR